MVSRIFCNYEFTNFQVSLYDLELIPDLDPYSPTNFTTDGKINIHLQTAQNLTESETCITLHAKQLKIIEENVTINDAMNDTVAILGHEYDIDREFYTIHLAQKLLSESDYVVSIPFLSILNDDLSGFYRR